MAGNRDRLKNVEIKITDRRSKNGISRGVLPIDIFPLVIQVMKIKAIKIITEKLKNINFGKSKNSVVIPKKTSGTTAAAKQKIYSVTTSK
jgi:hypothetical protein